MSVAFDPVSITGITRSGIVATATVVDSTLLYVGQLIYIYGANQAGYNGPQIVNTIPGATTFTFQAPSTTTTPATGTILYRGAGSPYIPLSSGPLVLPPAAYHSAALENSAVLKVNAGRLMSFYGTNQAATGCWIMLFDATSLPADGALPLCVIAAGQTDNFFIDVPDVGIRFSTGIVAAASTTGNVLAVKTDSLTHFDAAFHD